jgi:hypothetical protein
VSKLKYILNLFGSNTPLHAASDFVGWVATKLRDSQRGKPREKSSERSDTHQIPGGQQTMGIAALNPSYTSNTSQLAAGCFIGPGSREYSTDNNTHSPAPFPARLH